MARMISVRCRDCSCSWWGFDLTVSLRDRSVASLGWNLSCRAAVSCSVYFDAASRGIWRLPNLSLADHALIQLNCYAESPRPSSMGSSLSCLAWRWFGGSVCMCALWWCHRGRTVESSDARDLSQIGLRALIPSHAVELAYPRARCFALQSTLNTWRERWERKKRRRDILWWDEILFYVLTFVA